MKTFKKQFIALTAILLLALAFLAVPAAADEADFNVYLKLDGIQGDSLAKGYEKWIPLTGIQFDATNNKSIATASAGAGAGKASLESFTIQKTIDSASVPLFLNLMSGKAIPKGQIVLVRKTGDMAPLPVLTIDLENVFVTDYSFSDTYEELTLKTTSLKLTYTPMTNSGAKGTPIVGGWDFVKNTLIK
ncbi:Hcp family type VI secretion system effector [Paenibacillus aestuarii]|uniref:Hcp family type VI secretion system effector n=1 Tax=Paenibacillus aestuarii TaxID=516965 RepID=A0ABW0K157_9BACL|nr:type VI secretion system tube protein Hcp [Paenibacillus aestuarii]